MLVADLRRHVSLWWQLTRREIASRYRGSGLGAFWVLLGPLLEFTIYFVVFGFVFGGRYRPDTGETSAAYALGILLSLACHRLLADCLNQAPGVILSQPNFVKKVVFPLEILPLTLLGVLFQRFLLMLALFAIAHAVAGPPVSVALLWAPLILAPLMLLAVGLAWLFSALGVYLRDLTQLMPTVSMVMLFSSAVFYSPERLREQSQLAWEILRLNPLLQAVDGLRRCVLWAERPDAFGVAWLWVCSLAVAYVGHRVFTKLRKGFADVL